MSRALAVRQDNNGDVILAGPAVRGLAAAFEAVDMLCSPTGASAARLLPGVAETIVARTEWIDAAPQPVRAEAIAALVRDLRARAYDDAFIFGSFHQSPLPTALVLRLAGVRRIHAVSVDYPGSLLDTRVCVPDDLHEVERNLRVLDAAGVSRPSDDVLALTGLPSVERFALPRAYVVVHPGASVPARAWAPEKNRALVAALAARGTTVVVTGSQAEADLCRRTANGNARVLAGETTFAEYAAIVRDARALVVGNTAGGHVAAAVGTAVVSIFPPTVPAVRFRPRHVPCELLGDQTIACAGCRARVCPVAGQPCIGTLEPADVLAALDRLGARADVRAA